MAYEVAMKSPHTW